MAFLYHKLTRKVILTIILAWGAISFWFLNPLLASRLMLSAISLVGLIVIWQESAPVFLLILLSFSSAYALYGFFTQWDSPIWLVMLAILIIFGYLFTYTEQKTGILGNKRLIYLVLFSLMILEVFLALSYFHINPLNQSLVIAAVSYLFSGFCLTILARRESARFSQYFAYALIVIAAALLTSSWNY
ncbi:MAG: hypothetical protein AAB360_03900 [Patescibacteria group bacterium]